MNLFKDYDEPPRKPAKELHHAPPVDPLEGFDEFWAQYPKRVAKIAAQRAWRRLKPSQAVRNLILADIARRRAGEEWRRNRGQFVPHASTYLNQERWTDETQEDDPHAGLREWLGGE